MYIFFSGFYIKILYPYLIIKKKHYDQVLIFLKMIYRYLKIYIVIKK